MNEEIHNKATFKGQAMSEEQIIEAKLKLETKIHLYCALTGTEDFYVGAASNDLLIKENVWGDKESIRDERYIAVGFQSSYKDCNAFHYKNSEEMIDMFDVFVGHKNVEDNIPWYRLESDNENLDKTFAKDNKEFFKNQLLEAGYLEENIVESELMTSTENIKNQLIRDFGFTEECFYMENGQIHMDANELANCETINYEKLGFIVENGRIYDKTGKEINPDNYWLDIFEELGRATYGGVRVLTLSTYYNKMYDTSESLHKIYLTSIAAKDDGNIVNSVAKNELDSASLLLSAYSGIVPENGAEWDSLYKVFFGENQKVFDVLKNSDTSMELLLEMFEANSISELELNGNYNLEQALLHIYEKACQYFGLDKYVIEYQSMSEDWAKSLRSIIYNSGTSDWNEATKYNFRELLDIAKQHPEKISSAEKANYEYILREIEKFDNMNWVKFKSYVDNLYKNNIDDVDIINKNETRNIILNYLRELGLFTSLETYNPANTDPVSYLREVGILTTWEYVLKGINRKNNIA